MTAILTETLAGGPSWAKGPPTVLQLGSPKAAPSQTIIWSTHSDSNRNQWVTTPLSYH